MFNLTTEEVKNLALKSGFKLKLQANGSEDLNSYVYGFTNNLESEVLNKIKLYLESEIEQLKVGASHLKSSRSINDDNSDLIRVQYKIQAYEELIEMINEGFTK